MKSRDLIPILEQHCEVPYSELLDAVERRMLVFGACPAGRGETVPGFPVRHLFTPGLYVREIFMPAKSVLTSKVHRTEHPYLVSRGKCLLYQEDGTWKPIEAPHMGVTYPGTRRLLVMLEDTVWTTFHPNPDNVKDLVKLDEMLLDEYIPPDVTVNEEEAA